MTTCGWSTPHGSFRGSPTRPVSSWPRRPAGRCRPPRFPACTTSSWCATGCPSSSTRATAARPPGPRPPAGSSQRWSRCCATRRPSGWAGAVITSTTRSRCRRHRRASDPATCTRSAWRGTRSRSTTTASATTTMWPLYHDAVVSPAYHRHKWRTTCEINQRFAETVARWRRRARRSGCTTTSCSWCRRCCARCGPTCGSASSCTSRSRRPSCSCSCRGARRSSRGLLGADLVGFQTRAAPQLPRAGRPSARAPAEGNDVRRRPGGRAAASRGVGRSRSRSTPPRYDELARDPRGPGAGAGDPRRAVGSPEASIARRRPARLHQGHRRPPQRLTELLADGFDVGRRVFVQVATPSRENVEDYQRMRDEIDQIVGRVNGEHGKVGQPRRSSTCTSRWPARTSSRYYMAADIMLVTPLRDGMNLVAKEYVASRADGDGALVLSEFTGAANELRGGVAGQPVRRRRHEGRDRCAAIGTADDAHARMSAMRDQVSATTSNRWAAVPVSRAPTSTQAGCGTIPVRTEILAAAGQRAPTVGGSHGRRRTSSGSTPTSCAPRSGASPAPRTCSSRATTTAPSRRSSRTRRSATPLPEASPRCARSRCSRARRPRSSPAGRCATSPRCRGCPPRSTSSAATARSSTSASSTP